jgi:protein-tyrosine phosphatase
VIGEQPEILFVCWGNICRSPMAEVIATQKAAHDGVSAVKFASAGVSAEESGNPIDSRAVAVLQQAGYRVGAHSARQVSAQEVLDADLVIGMETLHLSRLRQLVPGADHLYLLTDFNPNAVPGSEIEDPWYGDADDFVVTLHQIEAAMPELMKRARELLR